MTPETSANGPKEARKGTIRELLRPHTKALIFGTLAAIGDAVANLLDPLPLKSVLDNVLESKGATGWLNTLMFSVAGADKPAIVRFAAIAVLAIALFGAFCAYAEKLL